MQFARRFGGAFTPERIVVFLLAAAVLLVHDVGYLLNPPFSHDEAWVAVTTRFPITALRQVTSSTPIGWSFLLHLVPFGGFQALRLLPLAFAGASVAAGYWFARRLDWPDVATAVGAGVLVAIAVLFAPASLTRNDLKQYTADAFFALLTLAVTSRLERSWSRRSLGLLAVTIAGGMLISHTVAFVGVAAFTSVVVVTLARRDWPRLAEAAVAGAVTAVGMLAVYVAFDSPAVVPGLTGFWDGYYVPVHSGLHASVQFINLRFHRMAPFFGLGPAWVAVPLVIAGVVTVFRCGRPATALTLVVLWPVMFVVAAAKKYPLLDHRTSTFLLTLTTVTAALGVAGIAAELRRWIRLGGAAAVATLAAAAFIAGVSADGYVREHALSSEPLRAQVRYVATHRGPDDVVVVNMSSNWGFGYYFPAHTPARVPAPELLQQYRVIYPDEPRIVMVANKLRPAVSGSVLRALAIARQHPGARIWLIRTHVSQHEAANWALAIRQSGVDFTPVGSSGLAVGRP
jgi:hypothetical protein